MTDKEFWDWLCADEHLNHEWQRQFSEWAKAAYVSYSFKEEIEREQMKKINSIIIEGTIKKISKNDRTISITLESNGNCFSVLCFNNRTTCDLKVDDGMRVVGSLENLNNFTYISADYIEKVLTN